MTKPELVQSLQKRKKEVLPLIQKIEDSSSPTGVMKKIHLKKPAKKESFSPTNAAAVMAQSPVSSPIPDAAPVLKSEPEDVWHGEQGPELPKTYGRTILHAMPRDTNWIYVYWEISEATRKQLVDQNGGWFFETAASILRILDAEGKVFQEIPVLLDSMCWYLSLPSSRDYHFEIGLKSGEEFILIARSNPISLSQSEPSRVLDEEWAVVEERFAEMVSTVASGEKPFTGSSEQVTPHLAAQRFRIPWEAPSLQEMPSSFSIRNAVSGGKN